MSFLRYSPLAADEGAVSLVETLLSEGIGRRIDEVAELRFAIVLRARTSVLRADSRRQPSLSKPSISSQLRIPSSTSVS